MIDKKFEWMQVLEKCFKYRRQVQFFLKINTKKVGRKWTIYAHACNKQHCSDSFRKKINKIKWYLKNHCNCVCVRFYLFLVYLYHWSTLINQQGSVINDQILHTQTSIY